MMNYTAQASNFERQYPMMIMDVKRADVKPSIEMQFEAAFKSNFGALHAYACAVLGSGVVAEDIVQQVFYKLWKNKDRIMLHQSLVAYLYKAVYHDCLNHLKHQKVKDTYKVDVTANEPIVNDATDTAKLRQLQQHLQIALNELPEQCRAIFQMSRFEELKYLEIANRLGISIKTVENQMGKALKILRCKLADYLPSLIFILINFI